MSEVPLYPSCGQWAHTPYRRALGPAYDLLGVKSDPLTTQVISEVTLSTPSQAVGGHGGSAGPQTPDPKS